MNTRLLAKKHKKKIYGVVSNMSIAMERRDLLKNTAKVFYEECNIEIEKECGKYITSLSDLDGRLPMEEVSEISMVLKHIREDYREKSNDLYQQKLAEIEEGYQQYLSKEEKTVTYTVSSASDLFDVVSCDYLAKNVSGSTSIKIPADSAVLITEIPAGASLMEKDGHIYADKKHVVVW